MPSGRPINAPSLMWGFQATTSLPFYYPPKKVSYGENAEMGKVQKGVKGTTTTSVGAGQGPPKPRVYSGLWWKETLASWSCPDTPIATGTSKPWGKRVALAILTLIPIASLVPRGQSPRLSSSRRADDGANCYSGGCVVFSQYGSGHLLPSSCGLAMPGCPEPRCKCPPPQAPQGECKRIMYALSGLGWAPPHDVDLDSPSAPPGFTPLAPHMLWTPPTP